MRVPTQFNLYGQTITVKHDPALLHKDDARGLAVYRENEIRLAQPCDANPFHPSQVGQVFLHELMHFIFFAAGYEEDRKDEVKVDRISHLIHQALTTMQYEEPTTPSS